MIKSGTCGYSILVILLSIIIMPSGICMESLENAWEIAIKTNHSLRAAKETTESTKKNLDAARSRRLPGLIFEGGYTVLDDTPEAKFGGGSIPLGQDEFLAYNATASITIFSSGVIKNGIDAAKFALQAAFSDQDREQQDLKMKVAEAYVAVLRSKRGVAVAESNVKSLTAHARDVENMYKQGFVAINDLLAARVVLADAVQNRLKARNLLDIAYSAYNRLLGYPLTRNVEIEELNFKQPEESFEFLIDLALTRRHELKAMSKITDALRRQAKVKFASYGPQVALSGGYRYYENKYQEPERAWTAALGFKWNLFDGGTAMHQGNAIIREAQAISEKRSDLESIIALQLRQAWLNVEESHKRIKVTLKALEQSEENLMVVKDRYREGLGTNTEVLDAETLRTKSHVNNDNAVYDATLSILRLRRSVGNL